MHFVAPRLRDLGEGRGRETRRCRGSRPWGLRQTGRRGKTCPRKKRVRAPLVQWMRERERGHRSK
jgi:hypothetical protein